MLNRIITTSSLFLLALIFTSFSSSSSTPRVDLNGVWLLQIDQKIDRKYGSNQGCSHLEFTMTATTQFSAKYTKCGAASKNALPSKFSGNIHKTSRGVMINMVQNNQTGSQYFASYAAKLNSRGEIEGLWVDLEGNRGEFKLIQQ